MSSASQSSHRSNTGSVQAQLRARAAAARYRADEEARILQLEMDKRLLESEVNAREAEIESEEFDLAIREMDNFIEENKILSTQDRVREFMTRKEYGSGVQRDHEVSTPRPPLPPRYSSHSWSALPADKESQPAPKPEFFTPPAEEPPSHIYTRKGTTVPPPPRPPPSAGVKMDSDYNLSNLQIAEVLVKTQLPKIECECFKGDAATYVRWKRHALVQLDVQMSPTERLIRLSNLVAGEPRDIVLRYSDQFPDHARLAYEKVWETLDKRYGRSSVIADALLEKLNDFQPFKDYDLKTLRKFSDLCASINVQIDLLPGLGVLNYPNFLKPVAAKLPPAFQRKWIDVAYKLMTSGTDDYPKFAQFSSFLEKLAEKHCDPNLRLTTKTDIRSDNSGITGASRGATGNTGPGDITGEIPNLAKDKEDDNKSKHRRCVVHPDLPTDRAHPLFKCKKFRSLDPAQKAEILSDRSDICRSCLEPDHMSANCTAMIKCYKDDCSKKHYEHMHEACELLRGSDRTRHAYSGSLTNSASICPAQSVSVSSTATDIDGHASPTVTVLYDSGSNVTLVADACRRRHDLRQVSAEPVTLRLEVVGGDSMRIETHTYHVPLLDQDGQASASVVAYAVPTIGSDLPRIDMTRAAAIFGLAEDIHYPSGPIDLLVGTDNAHATPCIISKAHGMILAETGTGKLIYGSHPSFANDALHTSFKVTVKPTDLRMDLVPSLFATDVLGISCTPKCGGCACKNCPVDGGEYTLQERYEFEQIKNSMTLENGVITASYPYVRDPAELQDNYELALKRLKQTERSLLRDSARAGKYQEQIDDMIRRGVMRKLPEEEEAAWTGPIQYLPHNDVIKPGSESTPTRLVFDPSAPFKGKSVNQFWGRGPCLINDPIGILIRFREFTTAFAGDISKMYWNVHTRPQEWHLHRVLWRDLDASKPPDKYIIVRNSFGSGPAGTVAIAALNFLAERKEQDLPDAAKTIKNQAFVDDIVDSAPTVDDAQRITGQIDSILGEGSFAIKKWTIVNIDENSSSAPPREMPLQQDSVLGLAWDTANDEFYFNVHLNFSKKRKKIRTGPDLAPGQVSDKSIVPALTKRSIMSQVHSLYDPLGLLAPFVVELKFAIAKLWRLKDIIDWDTAIPDDHDLYWRRLFELFFEIPKLRFPRVLRPSSAVEPPILLAFSDSSMISYCAVLYVRWVLEDGSVFARILIAKSRTWPIEPDDYLSVARGELMGVLLAKRLAATVLRESRFQFSETLYVTDSEICLAQINTNSHEFGVWTGNRVAEIRHGTELSQFWFTNSENNVCADFCSRGTISIAVMGSDSPWQRGPDWIYQPRSEWPLTQSLRPTTPIPDLRTESLARRTLTVTASAPPDPAVTGQALRPIHSPAVRPIPCQVFHGIQKLGESLTRDGTHATAVPLLDQTERLDIATFTAKQEDFIASRFDLTRHDRMGLWLSITARVLQACSWKPGKGNFFDRITEPDIVPAADRTIARLFWIRQAQKQLKPAMKDGKFASLTPYYDDEDVIRTNRRSLATSDYHPILLPKQHPFTRLTVIEIHRRCHDGRGATASRSRAEYHILGVRQLAASVRTDCQLCTLKEKRLMQVPMAPLPTSRTQPSLPFEHASCDIFGPFPIKIEGRVTRNKSFDPEKLKAYGVVFTCLTTRAVHISTMQGQDTDAFLLAYRSFIALRGQPKTMWSDNGGQIVAADQELHTMIAAWDDAKLRKFGAENGIDWKYASPGSPWQNGVSEAMIKSIKRSLQMIIPNKQLTILELQTLLLEVAELLNERPIGLGSRSYTGDDFDSETNSYLCPNQLLLGRASTRIPAGPFTTPTDSVRSRILALETLVSDWWKKWHAEFVPSLVNMSKWHKSSRPAEIGDMVQVRDLNPVRGDWGMGEIIAIKPNADNIPRNVLVQYKIAHPGKDYRPTQFRTQWRDVKNLSLLVPARQ